MHKDQDNPNKNVPKKKRAIEKTAFMQSLMIFPAELDSLRRSFIVHENDTASKKTHLLALDAVEILVNDKSNTSTINNASLFADIEFSAIRDIVNPLIEYRNAVLENVNTAVLDIQKAYNHNKLGTDCNSKNEPEAKDSGQPDNVSRFSMLNIKNKPDEKTSTSKIETCKQPNLKESVYWAQCNNPELFNKLHQQILPYTSLNETQSELLGKGMRYFFWRSDSSVFRNTDPGKNLLHGSATSNRIKG